MWAFIGLLSFTAWIVLSVLWIVSLVKKNGKAKMNFFIGLGCFILLIVAFSADPAEPVADGSDDVANESVSAQNSQVEVVELSPEEKAKTEAEVKAKAEAEAKAKAEEEAKKKEEAEKQARIDKIESQFSAWDGSHKNLTKVIKDAMNDPKSYDHVETVYWDMKDHLIVQTTFRGKNAFGGVVKNLVKAKVSLDGEVLEIIDQQ